MREIKFRGWDGETKRMYLWDELCGRSKTVPEAHPITCLYSHNDDSWKVMQFTGFKDKSGREIYEGDLDSDYNVVSWCDKRNGWAMKVWNQPTKEIVLCHCYNCEGDYELADDIDDIEIIGNIYENPELLK